MALRRAMVRCRTIFQSVEITHLACVRLERPRSVRCAKRSGLKSVAAYRPHVSVSRCTDTPRMQANALAAFEAGYDLAAEMKYWGDAYHIAEAGGLLAYAPPFARFPYEVWISAIEPVSGPWAFNETQSDGFAHLLGDMIARYDAFFGCETPVMLTLHAAPYGRDGAFQFTAQFYPLLRAPDRIKYLASVEQATGIFTVDIMPEQTAERLRGAL